MPRQREKDTQEATGYRFTGLSAYDLISYLSSHFNI